MTLQEFDFHVRWPGVKLLTSLLKQQGPQLQQIILVSPMGKEFGLPLANFKTRNPMKYQGLGDS